MIERLLKERILILDGAMGTMLQRGFSIAQVHKQYIDAGADIIETATFNLEGYEKTYANAAIARKAADTAGRTAFVAGSLGPYDKMLSLSYDAMHPESRSSSFDLLVSIYKENAKALIDAGVDLILLETAFDSLNAKAALYALEVLFEAYGRRLPVMVSATVNDRQGRLLTGMQVEAFYHTVEPYSPLSFGVNCSFGASDLESVMDRIARTVHCATSIYPNAGLPDEMGAYAETPEFTASCLRKMADKGLINIAGGCCGTTPEHISAIRQALDGIKPRQIPVKVDNTLTVTGLTTIKIDCQTQNFTNVGERTNVAGSRKFARLISEGNYEEAAGIARRQIEDGAKVIDVNLDDPLIDSAEQMGKFIRYITNDPQIASAALMIDSSDWKTLVEGIKNSPGRCIANSISLKDGENAFIERARELKRLGAAATIMAFDENGQATTYERKKEICERSFKLLTDRVGFRPEDLIFDCNILTVGTGVAEHSNYAVDFIRAVSWIKDNLPGAHTSGGVSNLSFAFRGNNTVREAMHSAFLYHAIKAGLDMAIVNPGSLLVYETIDPTLLKSVEDVVLNRDVTATERLLELATSIQEVKDGRKVEKPLEQWRKDSAEKRLEYALIHGVEDYLESDMKDALTRLDTVSIVEGPLMDAMSHIGKLFGDGQMFLPQVIKSAKVMRSAVEILQPYMTQSTHLKKRKKMVLATALGDIHDIGKNIVATVLGCNGIDVVDLGVMVNNADIIQAIKRHNADYAGISGLISPSLSHMEDLCRMMQQENMSIPLFVGGAATSDLHTAIKLAPLYRGPVIHTSNASECADVTNRLAVDSDVVFSSIRRSQNRLAELYSERKEHYVSLEDARQKARQYDGFINNSRFVRELPGTERIRIETLIPFIDWRMFLSFWGFKDQNSVEASRCIQDGHNELSAMLSADDVEVLVRAEFFDAYGCNEEIVLPGFGSLDVRRSTSSLTEYGSLADFFPKEEKNLSRVGLFAVKVEDKGHSNCTDCRDYRHMMREALCERIAEAAAEWIQSIVLVPDGCRLIRPAFGYPSCPDHSLKKTALDILDPEHTLGISLTDSFALVPATSVCGMLICHPEAHYINIRNNESH